MGCLLALVIAAQLAAADSAYESESLRALLAGAAEARERSTASYRSLRARAESEVALLLRAGADATVVQLEQVRSEIRWRSPDVTRQHIIAYRSSATKPTVSAISVLRRPWVLVASRGRLRLPLRWPGFAGADDADAAAPHPLDAGRDSVYRFAGGDTATVALPGGDAVVVRRVSVVPRCLAPHRPTLLFRGEIDIEPATGEVVRLRGVLLLARPHRTYWHRLLRRSVRTIAVAELLNAPAGDGRWLPVRQRVELQLASPLAEGDRAILRVTTHIREHVLDDPMPAFCGGGPRRPAERECLTMAPADSLGGGVWSSELGTVTATGAAGDFDDVASSEWGRASSPSADADSAQAIEMAQSIDSSHGARYAAWLERAARLREGLDLPGLEVGAAVRRSWSGDALQGALGVGWKRAPWTASLGVQRELLPGGGLLPMPGGDDGAVAFRVTAGAQQEDSALLVARHVLGGADGARLRIDAGPASVRGASFPLPVSMPCLLGGREDRSAIVGRNFRMRASLDLGPEIAESRGPDGVGAGVRYHQLDCESSRRRVEAQLVARGTSGAMSLSMRLDGAAASVSPLRVPTLPGFPALTERGFGEPVTPEQRRAARARFSAGYRMSRFAAPLRSLLWLHVPSGTPSVVVTLEGSWRETITRAPERAKPGGSWVDAALELTVRPFGSALGVGVRRSLVHASAWRLVLAADPR